VAKPAQAAARPSATKAAIQAAICVASLSGSNGSAHGSALSSVATARMLAATAPVGAVAVQLGTLVKLVRVLMLGSVPKHGYSDAGHTV